MTTDVEIFNIAEHLPRMAALQPDTPAILFPLGRKRDGSVDYQQVTFAELDYESDRIATGLESIGIETGVRTVLMVKPSIEFFALTFALFKVGAVPVFIDPGLGIRNLGRCIADAAPTAFIGIRKAHMARALFGWGRDTVRIKVSVGGWVPGGGIPLEQLKGKALSRKPRPPTPAQATAAILFTSGSTGPPKGAVYSHGNFAAQVEMLRETYDITPGEIDVPTFPLFALFDPALGMTAVIPAMDFTSPGFVEPYDIFEPIDRFQATNLFGSPALIDRVGRAGEAIGWKFPSLKRVLSAGAPVPAKTLARFAGMLGEGVEIFTPYGSTESLPVASVGSDTVLRETGAATARGEGVCVGRPVQGAQVDIFPITEDAIEEWSEAERLATGEIGEIVVRGPMVTREYVNRPHSTRLAKIPLPGGGVAHRMGDLGYLDDAGRLWFCGRKTHRVQLGQETLFTIPCEGIFNKHDAVFRSALVGVPRGEQVVPVICVELEKDPKQPKSRVRIELLDLAAENELTQDIRTVLFHPKFPVDIRHNAKIFRERLAQWADRRVPR